MSNDSRTLVMGRIELQPQQTLLHPLNRDHRETTLLYQQKVAALIECARTYANNANDAGSLEQLLLVALQFNE